jgi:signal transduction histidine kinase
MEFGTRSRQWLVVALVAATIISGIALLLRSSYLAAASRLDLVQMSAADLYRLSALEWEAIASEQVEAETRATLEGLTAGLVTSGESLAEQGVLPGDALGQLAVLIDGLNRELDLLEAGRLDAALEVDEEVVDPTFDRLMIVYQRLAVEARAKAERTNLVTGLLFVILILAGVVLSSFGVRKSESLLRLEQLVQIKDRFTASVSHELRTPLTVALGIAEILEEGSHGMGGRSNGSCSGCWSSRPGT